MRANILIICLLFTTTLSSLAQVQLGAELHIKLSDSKTPFLVSIDNRLFYNPDDYFSIGNLNGGNHDFKMYRYIPLSLNRIDSTLLICEGVLSIPPSSRMLIIVDPLKYFYISEIHNPLQYSINKNIYNSIYSKYFPIVPYDCLDSNSFNALLEQLKVVPFNDLKVTLIKESIFFSGITTAKLKELLQLFSFDNQKIDIAVFAYGSCVDRQNFLSIKECFAFNLSEQDLRNKLAFYYNYNSTLYRK